MSTKLQRFQGETNALWNQLQNKDKQLTLPSSTSLNCCRVINHAQEIILYGANTELQKIRDQNIR